jgi:hypothetical protein
MGPHVHHFVYSLPPEGALRLAAGKAGPRPLFVKMWPPRSRTSCRSLPPGGALRLATGQAGPRPLFVKTGGDFLC